MREKNLMPTVFSPTIKTRISDFNGKQMRVRGKGPGYDCDLKITWRGNKQQSQPTAFLNRIKVLNKTVLDFM